MISAFMLSNSKAQTPPRTYALASTEFYISQLASIDGLEYAGAYSSDLVYVRMDVNSINLPKTITSGLTAIQPLQKISYLWMTPDSVQDINIACYNEVGLKEVITGFQSGRLTGQVLYARESFLSLRVRISKDDIEGLLNEEEIKFITFLPPHVQEINFVERTAHRVSQFAPNFPVSAYLTGKGITMAEWDGGDVGRHIDFDNRLTLMKGLGINSHATHVAGTMAGAGNLDPLARGMAPEAKIYSWDFNGDIPLEMDTCKNKLGYVLTQNSYGYWTGACADFAQYDATSTDMDKLCIKYPDLLHVFAAGNSRSANCVAGGYKTILSGFQSAKNTISIAAVTSTDGDSYFSCAGPTQDGRFKPEVSTVGVNVYSTQDNNTYAGGWSGTSMATPGASGSIALVYERFKAKYGYIPQNYLGKNIISNTADDIGNAGPDYLFGFGRINGQGAVNLIDSGFWNIDSVANNASYLDTFYIPAGLNQVKVMLTWNDVEVPATNTGPVLVNDLDLTVTDSAGTVYNAWWCNPALPSAVAVRKRDSINNIEQVTISNPRAGMVIVKVYGRKIPNGKQKFAVTYMKEAKGITVVYPNGNETMESPSNASKAQLLRWDSKGVSGNFTIDFSRDNGTSWQNIASNVPNTQNYYTWQTLPDTVSTSRALIRVSSGSIKDVSNTTFNITGMVSGISTLVCDSQVFLRWRKVPNTAFYRVYQLQNGKMVEKGTPGDTSMVITGLSNNVAYWFSVSRKGTNGAESQRSVAVSATPNSAVLPPRVTLQPKDTFTCFNNLYFAKSKAVGTAAITARWEFSNNNGSSWNAIPNNADSINLKLYTSDFSFQVRRTYTNQCLAPVYTRVANIRLDSFLDVRFLNRDSIVCKNSVIRDSVWVRSKIPSIITWYNDSLTFTKTLQKGFQAALKTRMDRSFSIWAEVANYCGTVKTKDLTKPSKLNGRNDYTLFPAPQITIADTVPACIGETININPVLSGGRPGFTQLIIQTEDSSYLLKSLPLRINKDQWVTLRCFDNCYPDTIVKSVFIRMRAPLSVQMNNDSTICYDNKITMKALASGGNGNYVYNWMNLGTGPKNRTFSLQKTAKFKVTVTDNCTQLSASDSAVITVLDPLSLKVRTSKDTSCKGNIFRLFADSAGGRSSTYSVVWNDTSLSGFSPTVTATQSGWFKATLTDGCSQGVGDSVYVAVRPALSLKIDPVDTLCYGKQVTLRAVYSGGIATPLSVSWSISGQAGNTVAYVPTATQTIYARLTDYCTFPSVTDSLRVNVYDALKLVKLNDTQTCYGKALSMSISSNGGKTGTQRYYWQYEPRRTTDADSFASGLYTYTVADACKDSITDIVAVKVSPKLKLTPDFIRKCSYSDLQVLFSVNTSLTSTVVWDRLPAGKTQVFKDSKSTRYTATLSDGCSDTSMISVPVVISDFSANDFKIEKVVSKTAFISLNQLPYKTFFNWNDGSTTAENTGSAVHTYSAYGRYSICRILKDDIACTDTVCKTADNFDPAGFKDFVISLYPNPVKDELKFTFNQLSEKLSIEIIDANGKAVFSEHWVYPAYALHAVDLRGIAAGVYTVKIISNGESFIRKFVKL